MLGGHSPRTMALAARHGRHMECVRDDEQLAGGVPVDDRAAGPDL